MKRTVEETPRLQGAGGGGAGGSGCTWVTQSALKGPGCKTGGPGLQVQSSLSQWQGADHFNLESTPPPAPRREWSHVGISASGDTALRASTGSPMCLVQEGGRGWWEGGRAGRQRTPTPSLAPAHVHPLPQPLACILPVRRGLAAVSLYCGVWFAVSCPYPPLQGHPGLSQQRPAHSPGPGGQYWERWPQWN